MTIYTMGYEGLDAPTFMLQLAAYNIETVVDVRELPQSRKRGFSKTALRNGLADVDIEYVHMVRLGCPRPVRRRYQADGDWARYTESFISYLRTQEEAIAELSALAAQSRCALLCFEADAHFCHRSFVAEAVRARCDADVFHIPVAPPTRTAHPATGSLASV